MPKPSIQLDSKRSVRIALFNHKGGVSKTTTTFNLGWMLASLGHRVIMVDADSQCNLTGLALGYSGEQLEDFYEEYPERNIWSALAPVFESRPVPLEAVQCEQVKGQAGLFVLPGHIRFEEYDVSLGIAQELSGSLQALQNLPGAISTLLRKTAKEHDADFVLIDMSPGLTSINQNLLVTSDFFMIPMSPDYFSLMAIESLTKFLPRWARWLKRAKESPVLEQATYPLPEVSPKLLGTIVQKYRILNGRPTKPYQQWVDRLSQDMQNKLIPALRKSDMLLSQSTYQEAHVEQDLSLAHIREFNSLIALSQQQNTPVYALTDQQLSASGVVLEQLQTTRDEFRRTFKELAEKVSILTSSARAVRI